MDFQEKFSNVSNMVSDFYQNQMLDYLKFVLYGTEDRKLVEEKEQALRDLMLGMHEISRKNFETATGFMNRALNLFSSKKDDLHTAFSEFFLGEIYRMKEDFSKAQTYYQKAFDIFSAKKNRMADEVEEKIKEMKSAGSKKA